jgi:hypothetical protein
MSVFRNLQIYSFYLLDAAVKQMVLEEREFVDLMRKSLEADTLSFTMSMGGRFGSPESREASHQSREFEKEARTLAEKRGISTSRQKTLYELVCVSVADKETFKHYAEHFERKLFDLKKDETLLRFRELSRETQGTEKVTEYLSELIEFTKDIKEPPKA